MALSQQVEDSLREAEARLRNALAFAARNERPMMCKSISETIFKIDNVIKTDGGRVLCVTALGKNTTEAQLNAYNCVEEVNWKDCFYRTDIGYRAIERES